MDVNYAHIKELLKDITQFLSITLANETLSHNAQTQKDTLLQRVSTYLPDASVSSPYIDMNGSSKVSDQCEEYVLANSNQDNVNGEFYEEFPEQHQIDDNQQSSINYENVSISAPKLREVAKKFGPLFRKEKFLFMEHLIRCWAGILGDMLFIYNSDKDIKPSTIIHIKGFEARPAPTYCSKDVKKRDCCLEIVCPGKKSFQFIARTTKDMEQWVACINEISQRTTACSYLFEDQGGGIIPTKRQLPSPPTSSSESEGYDDIKHTQHSPEEEIYHDISDIKNDLQLLAQSKDFSATSTNKSPSITNDKEFTDNDLVYDDICANDPSSVYYNMASQRTGNEDKIDEERKLIYDNNGDEDIYDDIGIIAHNKGFEISKNRPTHMGITDSGSGIQHIVHKIEGTLNNSKKNMFIKVFPDNSFGNNVPSDDLYEPIDSPNDTTHT